MGNTLILLFILSLISCQGQKESSTESLFEKNEHTEITRINEKNMGIKHVDFKQNPAEEYFFTRKYRLTKTSLFYFNEKELKKMNEEFFKIAKKLIDELPVSKLDKNIIGHETVMLDIPDWTMEIYFENKDTIFISSGGLPDDLQEYGKTVWIILSQLDSSE